MLGTDAWNTLQIRENAGPPITTRRRNSVEQTLAIIKPDAVARRLVGRILARIEAEEFRIRAMRFVTLSEKEAEDFYEIHRSRPFFKSLVNFMASGPIVVIALEASEAIGKWRTLMGATDPTTAEPGTLRREFGSTIERNATHGSDGRDTAAFELRYFFQEDGLV